MRLNINIILLFSIYNQQATVIVFNLDVLNVSTHYNLTTCKLSYYKC